MYLKQENRKIEVVSIKSDNIFEDVFEFTINRTGYKEDDEIIYVPTYFTHIQGSFEDYEKKLIKLDERLTQDIKGYTRLTSFTNTVDENFTDKFDKYWIDIKTPDVRAVMTNLEEVFVHICENENLRKILVEKFEIVLEMYLKQQLNMNLAKESIKKLLFICKKYYFNIMNEYYLQEGNPKILCYGQIYRDDLYFLLLMYFCGVDIIYFNPTKQEKFPFPRDIVPYIDVQKHGRTANITKIFVTNKDNETNRQETVAYIASQEINMVLHEDKGGIYGNWQFERYMVIANTIKTSYDEIAQLNTVEARFRQGFEVEDGCVYIPNIFSKISGISIDKSAYFDFFDTASAGALIIDSVPFSVKREHNQLQSLVSKEGLIDKDVIKKLPQYQFSHLKESVQDYILSTIQEMVSKKDVLFRFAEDENIDNFIVYESLTLERRYQDLLQNFDFPYKIPRIVIFHDNQEVFNKNDAIRVAFFVMSGFDVVIFTPSGYNDIEVVLNDFIYDVHKLESYDSNIKLGDRSKYRKIKKKRFFENLFGK